MSKHIPYGIRYGKRVTIDQISPSERGSRCDCVCELCGHPLIAAFSDHGTTSSHFRHHRGYLHCHFDVDEGMMNLVFEMLEKINEDELIDILNSGLEQFSIKDKVNRPRNISNDLKASTPVFVRSEKKEIQFKVIIESEEFIIRIVTKKTNRLKAEEKTKYLSISDLIHTKEPVTQDQIRLIVKQIVERLKERSQAVIRLNSRLKSRSEIISQYEDEVNSKYHEKKITPDFRDLTIRNGFCPVCGKGKLIQKENKVTGKPFFGCSNFPKCRYIHPSSDYYDSELKNWIFLVPKR